MMKRMKGGIAATTALVAVLALAACTTTEPDAGGGSAPATEQNMTPQGLEGRPTLAEFCGDEPVKVAYVVGFGSNSWRKIVLAEIQAEAEYCDNVSVEYFNAEGDQDKFISMINSANAQGFDAIVTYNDFGQAAVPALRAAFEAGMPVVAFVGDPGGTVGVDYTGFVDMDLQQEVEWWGEFMDRAMPDGGKLIYMGGLPGNELSNQMFSLFSGVLEDYPGLEMQVDAPIDTNWDPAESQRVTSGLFAQYPEIGGLVADYTAGTVPGIIRAYQNAGRPLVAMAGGSSSNELVCLYHELKPTNPDFEMFGAEGNTYAVRIALRQAVAAVQGLQDDESWVVQRFIGIDTTQDIVPECREDLPADADLWSSLTEEQLAAVFAQ